MNGQTIGLNSDTLGGILKANLAQYLALEIAKGNEGGGGGGGGGAGGADRDNKK